MAISLDQAKDIMRTWLQADRHPKGLLDDKTKADLAALRKAGKNDEADVKEKAALKETVLGKMKGLYNFDDTVKPTDNLSSAFDQVIGDNFDKYRQAVTATEALARTPAARFGHKKPPSMNPPAGAAGKKSGQ